MMTLLASAFTGFALMFGGLFGMHPPLMHPDMASSTQPVAVGPQLHKPEPSRLAKVLSVSGTTLTVIRLNTATDTASTTYTVDASNARIFIIGSRTATSTRSTPPTVADIKIGDTVRISGSLSGTNVTATVIVDGLPPLFTAHPMQRPTPTNLAPAAEAAPQ